MKPARCWLAQCFVEQTKMAACFCLAFRWQGRAKWLPMSAHGLRCSRTLWHDLPEKNQSCEKQLSVVCHYRNPHFVCLCSFINVNCISITLILWSISFCGHFTVKFRRVIHIDVEVGRPALLLLAVRPWTVELDQLTHIPLKELKPISGRGILKQLFYFISTDKCCKLYSEFYMFMCLSLINIDIL